ncbi:MAG: hypothetical protein CME15_06265 [Gemmatimonadetes bacterium]|nr:hypothetical protein [Gemmatimonadota bacterium]
MTRIGRALAPLALAAALGLSAAASHAGEGFVIKVRGMGLTIDKGADDGMVVGMSVTVMRSPDEPVIHPITGENLGSPEIEIADGEITKVSARASSIRLPRPALLPVRPGDIVRYTTVDEQTTETAEGATQERRVIRGEARPAGNIKGVERSIKRLDRFDKDVVPRQFTRINKDIVAIKDELRELRETVTLLGSVPDIGAVTGEMPSELSEADAERLTELIQEVHARLAAQQQEVEGELPEAGPPLPDEARTGYEEIDDAGRDSFLSSLSPWIFIIVGVVGLAAVGLWLFMRMSDDEGRIG